MKTLYSSLSLNMNDNFNFILGKKRRRKFHMPLMTCNYGDPYAKVNNDFHLCLACVMVITSLRKPCLSRVVCGTLFPSSSKSNIWLTFVWIPESEGFWKFQMFGLRSWTRKLDVTRNVTASSVQAHSPSPLFFVICLSRKACVKLHVISYTLILDLSLSWEKKMKVFVSLGFIVFCSLLACGR